MILEESKSCRSGFEANPTFYTPLAEQLMSPYGFHREDGGGGEGKINIHARGRVLYYAGRMQKFRKRREAEERFPYATGPERKRRRAEIKRRGERERVKRGRERGAKQGGRGRERGRTEMRGGESGNSACSMIED